MELGNQKQKLSHIIGRQIGESLLEQGLELDLDILTATIHETFAGQAPRLSPEQMQATMMAAQQEMRARQDAEGAANRKIGEDFLAANKIKPDVTTTPSGLQYRVVLAGTGATPRDDDNVVCHYRGTFIDGTEFDSSYKRGEPAEFPVNGVIAGWTEALKTMKVGEKRQLFIPSDLAYGPQGRPSIPGNSVLLFDIELLEITR